MTNGRSHNYTHILRAKSSLLLLIFNYPLTSNLWNTPVQVFYNPPLLIATPSLFEATSISSGC
ncbi:hypothetical protein P3S67_011885 [Capsicum chacoense]